MPVFIENKPQSTGKLEECVSLDSTPPPPPPLNNMNRHCRQLSIKSPGIVSTNCVSNLFVPIEETPALGARIRIVCAGACYRRRQIWKRTKSEDRNDLSGQRSSPVHTSVREGALFPGFEVAGIIESFGSDVTTERAGGLHVGQRVIVYPFDEAPDGYTELLVVPDLKYVVPIPDHLPISVAAMLPTGALLAMNAVFTAHQIVTEMLQKQQQQQQQQPAMIPVATNTTNTITNPKKCKILVVGTGGLALWALRIAAYHFASTGVDNYVEVTVASLRDEGFRLATADLKNVNVVQWMECLYEPQLIAPTLNTCNGPVDIVIDFGTTTTRSLHRSLHCLSERGVVLIGQEIAGQLPDSFKSDQERIIPISTGTVEQLYELVELVANKKIKPPPHSVFPCEQAVEVIQKLCNSEIPGRAILRFRDIE